MAGGSPMGAQGAMPTQTGVNPGAGGMFGFGGRAPMDSTMSDTFAGVPSGNQQPINQRLFDFVRGQQGTPQFAQPAQQMQLPQVTAQAPSMQQPTIQQPQTLPPQVQQPVAGIEALQQALRGGAVDQIPYKPEMRPNMDYMPVQQPSVQQPPVLPRTPEQRPMPSQATPFGNREQRGLRQVAPRPPVRSTPIATPMRRR